MNCGLLGRHLGHSYSPAIHALLGDYSYQLFAVEPEGLEDFLRHGEFTGLNVTVPYKQAVIPFLDGLTDQAQMLGAVNTVIRQPDGTLLGHNTDYFGFQTMLSRSGLSVAGKKALVLGSGGAGKVCAAVLQQEGAAVTVISRRGENNYQNLHLHADTAILVNATPVGMYPDTGETPVDLALFPELQGVLDVIYNPARTRLLLDAQARAIPTANGLWMLVAQAIAASQCFTGHDLPDGTLDRVYKIVQRRMENIILIGMPGCGKTAVGKAVAQKLGREFVDTDARIEEMAGISVPELLQSKGEAYFRSLESSIIAEAAKGSGLVIATGGGCVTKSENLDALRQNGRIFRLQRSIEKLDTQGRPLSTDLMQLYRQREPMYRQFADCTVCNEGSLEAAVWQITEAYV